MLWFDQLIGIGADLRSALADWLGILGFFITIATFFVALWGVRRIGKLGQAAIGGGRSADLANLLQRIDAMIRPPLGGQPLIGLQDVKGAFIDLQVLLVDQRQVGVLKHVDLDTLKHLLDKAVKIVDSLLAGEVDEKGVHPG